MYLGSSAYDPRLYGKMQFNQIIDEYLPPQCPDTFEGASQYYDAQQGVCVPLNPRTFSTRN